MTATEYLSALATCLATPRVTVSGGDTISLNEGMGIAEWYVREWTGVVHLVGNGGSASVVAHAHNDLVKVGGQRALVHQDVPLLTAYANDNGYQNGYADALSVWVREDDVLIAVSSSGASPNMLRAAHVAEDAGAIVITFSGFSPDNPLRRCGDLNFYVPSFDYGQVELTHGALLHCLTDRLAKRA